MRTDFPAVSEMTPKVPLPFKLHIYIKGVFITAVYKQNVDQF